MRFGVRMVRAHGRGWSFGFAFGYDPTNPREAGLLVGFWRWTLLIGWTEPGWEEAHG